MPGVGGVGGRRELPSAPADVPETRVSGSGTGSGSGASRGAAVGLARLPFGRGARAREIGPGPRKLPEPSGVAFHEARGTLFVVGDRGHVAEVSRDGEVLRKERIGNADLEGICVGPGGRLFAVVEQPPKLLEIDPERLEVVRKMEIKGKLEGRRVVGRHANRGIEGLCWVPGERAFFAVNQDRPPLLLKLELPQDGKGKARVASAIDLAGAIRDQASDVAWDPATKHFLIAESGGGGRRGVLHEVARDGKLVRSIGLPGRRPEGFALDDRGSAFIAQDDGHLLRVDP